MKIITNTEFSEKLAREYSTPSTPGNLKLIAMVPKGTIVECNKAMLYFLT